MNNESRDMRKQITAFDAILSLLKARYEWFTDMDAQILNQLVVHYLLLRKRFEQDESKKRTLEMFEREVKVHLEDANLNTGVVTEVLTLWQWACENGASPLPSAA